jgi:predicted RNase H-like nuclease
MEKRFKVKPPTMPNFVRFEKEPQLKQDGFKAAEGFDIANFTEEEALEFSELMKREFLEHYRRRKAKNYAIKTK